MSRNTSSMEVVFTQSEQLGSITDVRSVITYVNDDFARVAGYSRDELVGQNHNIVRHPDMPAAAFAIYGISLKYIHSYFKPMAASIRTFLWLSVIYRATNSTADVHMHEYDRN